MFQVSITLFYLFPPLAHSTFLALFPPNPPKNANNAKNATNIYT